MAGLGMNGSIWVSIRFIAGEKNIFVTFPFSCRYQTSDPWVTAEHPSTDHFPNTRTTQVVSRRTRDEDESMQTFRSVALSLVTLAFFSGVDGWAADSTWTSGLTPPAKQIQFYPRTQCHKYWHFMNFLHWWNDRPLMTDRSLRPDVLDGQLVVPGSDLAAIKTSMIRDAELAKLYLVDGLSSSGDSSFQEPSYAVYLDALSQNGTTNYKHLLNWGSSFSDSSYVRDSLTKALASPYAARINGKVLVSSYAIDAFGPANIAAVLQSLRAQFGSTFLLPVEMTSLTEQMLPLYVQGQLSTSPSANLTAVKQVLRQYLDVADGIMVENCHHMETNVAQRYDNRFNLGFYRDCVIPIFKSVLAEPAYAGKLLGLGIVSGYCNARTGDNNSEECTRRLRYTCEAAINAAPDFIVMPEWNEQNENTSLQPTVNNSWTHRRIIEYYMRKVRGLALMPRAGDDLTIPNFIISYRKELKLGEALEIELLNVPDSAASNAYTATLTLVDAAGNTVRSFAPVSFNRNVMSDYTVSVASETLASYSVIRPVVRIQQASSPTDRTFSDGLMYVSLRPSRTIDYQTVKQPLRDLANPSIATLTVTSTVGRDVVLQGSVTASEPLTSVEIMADGDEVYAYDRLNEYDLANNVVIYGYHTVLPGNAGYDCDITVTNSLFQFKPVWMPEAVRQYQKIGETIRLPPSGWDNQWPGRFYLLIPKANQNTAVINMTSSKGSISVPVTDILNNGVYSKTLVSQFIIRLEAFHALADHPVPINANSVSFTAPLRADTDRPTYHLRIITQSGRTYRTKPITLNLGPAAAAVPLKVFSETQNGAVVTVSVPRQDILDLRYEFDSRCGDVLPTSAGPRWFAEMGGGTLYAAPFYSKNGGYPVSEPLSKPSWVTEDGAPSLYFSGNGQYLSLPTEAFPRGSFTLSFDIKPMTTSSQVLFRHHGILIGSFMIKIKNGKLLASHVDKLIQESYFDTGLDVPAGQWSRIVVSHDLSTLSFQVNQQTIKSYPFSGKSLYFQPSVFGGHLRQGFGVEAGDGFFQGYLKSLSIAHATGLSAAVNSPPVANGQTLTTTPGTPKNITLTGSDMDGDFLTSSVVTGPLSGTLSGTPPLMTYTPNTGFTGSDSFTFTVNDGQVSSAPATISINIATIPPGGSGGGSSSPSGGGGGGCGAGSLAALGLLFAQWCFLLRQRPFSPGRNE